MITEEIKTPNGLGTWIDVYFEVVNFISIKLNKDGIDEFIEKIIRESGRNGLKTLASDLTNEFEAKFDDEYWVENDFYDEIEKFLKEKIK